MKNILYLGATVIIFFLITTLQSCKREVDVGQLEKDMTVEQAKIWYNQQSEINTSFNEIKPNSTQSVSSKTKNQILKKIAGRIQWNSTNKFSFNKITYLMVEINDTDIRFKNTITASRRLIFYYDNSNFLVMNIVECINNNGLGKLEQEKAIEKAFLDYKQGINPKNTKESRIFIYDAKYNRCEKFEKGVIRESISRRNTNLEVNVKSSPVSNSSNSVKVNSDGCQLWGVFAITRDANGVVESEELLYTYWVGDCSNGGSGPNKEDNEAGYPTYGGDEEANQLAFYEAFIGMSSNSSSFTSNSNGPSIDPVSGTFVWTLVTGAGLWSIEAVTDYNYYHTEYFDAGLMRNVQQYNLFHYNTRRTYFTGFNVLVESTWTQSTSNDNVINNNTENTKGVSTVSGTIRHRMRQPLPGNWGILDRTFTVQPTTCNFFPR